MGAVSQVPVAVCRPRRPPREELKAPSEPAASDSRDKPGTRRVSVLRPQGPALSWSPRSISPFTRGTLGDDGCPRPPSLFC